MLVPFTCFSIITPRRVCASGVKQLVLPVCCLSSVVWCLSSEKNLEIYRVKRLLILTITVKISAHVYLIETKAVLFSAFPAASYLTSILSAILIRSTTRIRRRPGIHRLWTCVHATVYLSSLGSSPESRVPFVVMQRGVCLF